MYSPNQAETIIRHHAQHTTRLVEQRSRVRVPNRKARNRLSVWGFRRQAG